MSSAAEPPLAVETKRPHDPHRATGFFFDKQILCSRIVVKKGHIVLLAPPQPAVAATEPSPASTSADTVQPGLVVWVLRPSTERPMHWICIDERTGEKLLIHVDDFGEELLMANTLDEVREIARNMT